MHLKLGHLWQKKSYFVAHSALVSEKNNWYHLVAQNKNAWQVRCLFCVSYFSLTSQSVDFGQFGALGALTRRPFPHLIH